MTPRQISSSNRAFSTPKPALPRSARAMRLAHSFDRVQFGQGASPTPGSLPGSAVCANEPAKAEGADVAPDLRAPFTSRRAAAELQARRTLRRPQFRASAAPVSFPAFARGPCACAARDGLIAEQEPPSSSCRRISPSSYALSWRNAPSSGVEAWVGPNRRRHGVHARAVVVTFAHQRGSMPRNADARTLSQSLVCGPVVARRAQRSAASVGLKRRA